MSMRLVPLTHDMLRAGIPLPVTIRDSAGRLLLARGQVIADEGDLQRLMAFEPHVEDDEVAVLQRAWIEKLDAMVRRNESLGRIAQVQRHAAEGVTRSAARSAPGSESPSATGSAAGSAAGRQPAREALPLRLSDLQRRMGNTLKGHALPEFLERLDEDADTLLKTMAQEADDVLMVLISHATREYRDYAVHHCLLVGAVCALVALQDPVRWPTAQRDRLVRAALTMNLSILGLQNELALHVGPLTLAHQGQLKDHGLRSAQALEQAGVDEGDWLEAVAMHHRTDALAWEGSDGSAAMARLIHKADVFCARLSPRKGRIGLNATMAARFAYLDESGMPDAAGAALIRALGVYPPGTLVSLANQEIGIVRRRGAKPGSPWVASLVGASGMPLAEPVLRDGGSPAYRVKQALATDAARLGLNMGQLLARG